MGFSKKTKENALVKSRRCCCICHEFAGLYTNVHHIKPKSKKGPDTLENAIVLCLHCHGEVGHYNSEHPIGDKYTTSEVKAHRDKWWQWCEDNPYKPLPESPLIVSPSEINIPTEGYENRTEINIYNKTDAFLYQAWIKIVLPSNEIDKSIISISSKTDEDGAMLETDGIKVSPHMFQLRGVDSNEKSVIYVVIEKIKPKSTHILHLVAKGFGKKPIEKAKVFLVNFLGEPPEKGKMKKKDEPEQVYFTFTNPDLKLLESITALMCTNGINKA